MIGQRAERGIRSGSLVWIAPLALVIAGATVGPDPTATAEAVASAPIQEVSQQKKTFAPGEITIDAGEEVRFLNDDSISHNVFSRSEGSKFNLKIQKPGEHKSHRFEAPGTVVVRCAIHPNMKLTVNVRETPPDRTAP